MNFGKALEELKSGKYISRIGWNGAGMWVFLVPGDKQNFVADSISMRTARAWTQPGWLASQSDLLAEDWYVVSVLEE